MEERPDKRGYRQELFIKENGEQVLRLYSGDLHYNNKLGEGDGVRGFRKIDNTLEWDETKRGWGFRFHSYKPFLPEFADDWFTYRDLYKEKDHTIRFRPVAEHVQGQLVPSIAGLTNQNAVLYQGAFGNGRDLIIYFTATKMLKVVRIRTGAKTSTNQHFDFEFKFPKDSEIYRSLGDLDDGKYRLRFDTDKDFDTEKSTVIHMPKGDTYLSPFRVWDSGTIDGPLQGQIVELTPGKLIVEGNRIFLRKIVKGEMMDRSRGHVYTDTVISYQENKDTYYGTSFTTGGAPDSTTLNIGGWGDFYHSFLEFDLSSVGAASVITQALLKLRVNSVAVNDSTTFIRRITSAWTEAGVTSSSAPTNTTTDQVQMANPVTTGVGNVDSKNVTTIVNSWLNGTNPNYGFGLISTTNNNAAHTLSSSDDATEANRPVLELTGTFVTEYAKTKSMQYVISGQEIFNVELRDPIDESAGDFDIRLFSTMEMAAITKGLVYRVIREITAITKALVYSVLLPNASTLQDSFNDSTVDDSKWFNWGGADVVEANGVLTMSNPLNTTTYQGIDSDNFYRLTSSHASVEVVNAGNQALTSWEVMFQLFSDSSNIIFFLISGGNIRAYKKVAGVSTSLASSAYNATNHRWLRIREASGTTYWETSTDGFTWNTFHSVANPIATTALKIGLAVGTWQNEAATSAIFDNLNVQEKALTKPMVYRVSREITAITKTLVYRVTAEHAAITKALVYKVTSEHAPITKGMVYRVSREVTAITKPLVYAIQSAFEVSITKPLVYRVIREVSAITKGLVYRVRQPEVITKGMVYRVTREISAITKGLVYRVRQPETIQKGMVYRVVREITAITKGMVYRVARELGITKPQTYRVVREVGITKTLVYRVRQPESIAKSLVYRVSREIGITKPLVYRVIREIQAITKALVYKVTHEATAIQKGLSYEVLSEHALTKGLTYRVVAPEAIQKALTYKVLSEGALSKGMVYRVTVERSIALPMAYEVALIYTLTKPMRYAVTSEKVITKGMTYEVRFNPYTPKPVNPYTPKPVSPFGAKQSPFTNKQTPYTGKGTSPYIPL